MELEIINKRPIPKLDMTTTSAKPRTYRSVASETDGAIVSTEKSLCLQEVHLIASE